MLLCAEVYYGCMCGRSRNEEMTRLFAALIVNNASLMFFDQCAWLLRGVSSLRLLTLLANVFYYVNGRLLNYQLWVYVSRSLKLDDAFSRRANKLLHDLLIPVLLLSFANLFVPIFFSVDEQSVYKRETLFPLSYGYLLLTLIALAVGLARSKTPKKQKRIALSIIVLPLINTVLTFVFYGLPTQYPQL